MIPGMDTHDASTWSPLIILA